MSGIRGGTEAAARCGHITAKSVAKLLIDGTLTGTGSLSIADDVVDTGAEYILIRYMDGGSITCSGDLDLRTEDGGDWLVVGHGLSNANLPLTTHTGAINVGGVLTGRIYVRGYSALTIDVDEIDAGDDCGQGCTGEQGEERDERTAIFPELEHDRSPRFVKRVQARR